MAITTNGGAGVTADAVATLSNKTLEAPVINNATFTGAQAGLEIKFGNNIVLEGTTDNAFEMTLSGGDPTADRTVTLPDATGQVVLRDTTDTLTNKTLSSPQISNAIFLDGSILFEGATANNFETTLAITDPTADRTITFPDYTGLVPVAVGTGTNGQVLTSNGTNASWTTIDALPSQTGNTGKYLTTDGSTASWATVTTDPTRDIFMMMGA